MESTIMKYIESESVELKEKITDSLPKEIEAFLNTEGGIIYIGIKDDGEPIGVDNVDSALRKISDIVTDQIEPNAIESVKPEVVYEESKMIIKINVLKGFSDLYCLKKYGYSTMGCHIRVGTSCKSMTQEMIRYRYEKSFFNTDSMIKTPTFFGSISFRALKVYFSEKGYHLDEFSFERNLKLRTEDNRYNLLAELLSDKNSFPFIVVKFKGLTKADISERNDYGGESILLAYEKIKNRLIAENICVTDTTIRPRKDIYLYDIDAVNEVLVNALIHNDYRITQPLISLFDDRLEIISHGGLPNGLTRDEFFMGISKPRNEGLMEIFSRLGIVEHTGHGIPTVIAKYGKEVFDIHDRYINVVIPFNQEVLLRHGAISGAISGAIQEDLNAIEKTILMEIRKKPSISANNISLLTGIPFRTVQRHIANLKTKGLLVRRGYNKNGYWEIKE